MNRREFLKYFTLFGASVVLGEASAYANWLTAKKRHGFPLGMVVIDPHAHPDIFPCTPSFCDQTTTLEKIEELRMNASCFAEVGDRSGGAGGARVPVPFNELLTNLAKLTDLVEAGQIKIVRKFTDLPHCVLRQNMTPGAIIGLEGGDPIETYPDRVDVLYHDYGVRIITPMHYRINEIGDIMTASPVHHGLTPVGQQIVERMMSLGIIVDVAHAHIHTLEGIADIARANGVPIIDSHTSLTLRENPYGTTRLRTFEEMEMVAETGGVVCTWPLGWRVDASHHRTSFFDWAEENLQIAQRLGIEHVGLGTDAGGGLPDLIDGYESILDLPNLVDAMDEVGFNRRDIAAYMGGNLRRVIKNCIG